MKAPAFQFYVRDWLSDENLGRCSAATRGVWMDMLCYMWLSEERGVLRNLTHESIASLCRCDVETASFAVRELHKTCTCDVRVSRRNGTITVQNRRMVREESARKAARERIRRHREHAAETPVKRQRNADVTPPSASASASAKEGSPPTPHEPTETGERLAAAAGKLHLRIVEIHGKSPGSGPLTRILKEKQRLGFSVDALEACCGTDGVDAGRCRWPDGAEKAVAAWLREHGQTATSRKRDADDSRLKDRIAVLKASGCTHVCNEAGTIGEVVNFAPERVMVRGVNTMRPGVEWPLWQLEQLDEWRWGRLDGKEFVAVALEGAQ